MPHPPELIEQIRREVERSYPLREGYVFAVERRLTIAPAVWIPDITVSDRWGAIRCVVEIGYTRPEKLTGYRALGIGDVRWYDKAGRLHGDVTEQVIIRTIKERAVDTAVFVAHTDTAELPEYLCECCYETIAAEAADDGVPRVEYWEDFIEQGDELHVCLCFTSRRVIALCECDHCGAIFVGDPGVTAAIDDDQLIRLWRAAERCGVAEKLEFDEFVHWARSVCGLELHYGDFSLIR